MLDQYKDIWYIKSYINGNVKSFDKLLKKYEKQVYNFILSLVNDKSLADDIFQETFIKVIKNIKNYNDNGKFSSWIFAIAHNLCKDHWRKISHIDDGYDKFEMIYDENAVIKLDSLIDIENISWLREEVKKLPEKLRIVLVMHIYSELSFKDIADQLECSINTVLGRMHYAKQRLKERWLEYEKK